MPPGVKLGQRAQQVGLGRAELPRKNQIIYPLNTFIETYLRDRQSMFQSTNASKKEKKETRAKVRLFHLPKYL